MIQERKDIITSFGLKIHENELPQEVTASFDFDDPNQYTFTIRYYNVFIEVTAVRIINPTTKPFYDAVKVGRSISKQALNDDVFRECIGIVTEEVKKRMLV